MDLYFALGYFYIERACALMNINLRALTLGKTLRRALQR